MNTRLILMTVVAALLLAACGGDAAETTATAPPDTAVAAATTEAAPPAPAPTVISASAGQTDLGPTLVGENGLTLYGFTNDTQAASTCGGTCAEAWPPVIVSPDWDVAPDLDAGIFATTTRDDGSLQLVAGRWPLYYFAGDAAAGDINGQGSGDVWFAVDLDGGLYTDQAAAADDAAAEEAAPEAADGAEAEAAAPATIVSTGDTDLGPVLVDADGLTLYGFTNDVDGQPTCEDDCADAWPPVIMDSAELPEGLDAEVFSVVERPDGSFQLSAGVWPLYTFAGDGAPGDVNGQGSGDVWFAATPEGGLIRDGADAAAAEEAPAESDSDDGY
ncbi:hypothetical protein [Euzebya tangerina]|uniref:hypothetical protein n=1 Tax=Euzebya tangerina TaxID=591198 RepID=UPI0013C35470|nr:hypothetical protein [Euzebya tangerina]